MNCRTTVDRGLLTAILDELVPAHPDRGLPSAGAVGIDDFILERVDQSTEHRKALESLLQAADAGPDSVNQSVVASLEVSLPAEFNTLLSLTYMGYYSLPKVRELLGLSPDPVHPNGYHVERESAELLDELTAPVVARGRIYRET